MIAKDRDNIDAFMVTYQSTFGVFEKSIVEIIDMVHDTGGQVYIFTISRKQNTHRLLLTQCHDVLRTFI